MNRRRRGIVLGGLALALGALAASDVAGREAALERRIGPAVDVVVARRALPEGRVLAAADLAVRRVPTRFAPAGAISRAGELVGLKLAAPVAAGADLSASAIAAADAPPPGAPVRAGERVAEIVATGSAAAIRPGGRVDVLVTREATGDAGGRTLLALQDVEVLASAPAADGGPDAPVGARVAVSLRVSLRQAVYLAAAQAFARELRLLPRAAGDRREIRRPLAVADTL